MTPIHEIKTRKATWKDLMNAPCHSVVFEADGREVGVVIRDQPEAVAKPLIEAIAALPEMMSLLRELIYNYELGEKVDSQIHAVLTRVEAWP